MAEPFLGEIRLMGFNFAPRGWAFSDGQLLPISQNSALFSLYGTIYGGDGRTTFALPDLRGRVAIHEGHGPGLSNYVLGSKGGAETVTLTTANMPSHNHSPALHGEVTPANQNNPTGRMLGLHQGYADPKARDDVPMASGSIVSSNIGGGQNFGIRQPYLTVNYCVALTGLFPSRS